MHFLEICYNTPMKNCLAVFKLDWAGLDYFSGVLRYFSEIKDRPFRLYQSEPFADFTAAKVRDSRYDGFIVPLPGTSAAMKALAESDKPTVLLNINDPRLSLRTTNVRSIWVDNFDIGKIGAEHLLSRGDFRSYGFIELQTAEGHQFYSHERETAFRNTLKAQGIRARCFPGKDGDYSDDALAEWLSDLPKPAAVMAANDLTAVRALECCNRLRIPVPGMVALLGVDDVTPLTTGNGRSLSSIKPDFSQIGYIAAKELVAMLNSRRPGKFKEIVFPVGKLIARDSTNPPQQGSRLAESAMDYIRQNANRAITSEEVAAAFGRSRRLLDMRFRDIYGKTVSEVIAATRMERIRERLLQPGTSVSQVAAEFGFDTPNQLSRNFKRHFGTSVRTLKTGC